MSAGQLSNAIRHIRRLLGGPGGDDTDRALMQRYAADRDEEAFHALVKRHGPMVLGVCRRVLGHHSDADDAFQVTFLVLARKAGTAFWRESVGSWLYGVAYRTAQKARTRAARRSRHEQEAAERQPISVSENPEARELRQVLDAELQRMPEKFRMPLVLCCLQDQTVDEAAQHLGWGFATLKGRLQRGRELLRDRLQRRGIELSAGVLGTVVTQGVVSAVPPTLAAATVHSVTSATTAAPVGALLQGVLRAMFWTNVKSCGLVLLLVGLLGAGVGILAYSAWAGNETVVALDIDAALAAPLPGPEPVAAKKTERVRAFLEALKTAPFTIKFDISYDQLIEPRLLEVNDFSDEELQATVPELIPLLSDHTELPAKNDGGGSDHLPRRFVHERANIALSIAAGISLGEFRPVSTNRGGPLPDQQQRLQQDGERLTKAWADWWGAARGKPRQQWLEGRRELFRKQLAAAMTAEAVDPASEKVRVAIQALWLVNVLRDKPAVKDVLGALQQESARGDWKPSSNRPLERLIRIAVHTVGEMGEPRHVPALVELARARNQPEFAYYTNILLSYAAACNRLTKLNLNALAEVPYDVPNPVPGNKELVRAQVKVIRQEAFEKWLEGAAKLEKDKPAPEPAVKDGLSVTVTPAKAVFVPDEGYVFGFTYKNESKRSLRLFRPGGDYAWNFTIAEVGTTNVWHLQASRSFSGGNHSEVLEAGQSVTASVRVNQLGWILTNQTTGPRPVKPEKGNWIEVLKPGRYQLKADVRFVKDPLVGMDDPFNGRKEEYWFGDITTNAVEFRIVAEDTDIAWGEVHDGIRFGLAPRNLELVEGEEALKIQAWFENVGKDLVRPSNLQGANVYRLMLAGEKSGKPFYADYRNEALALPMGGWHTLKPGERVSEEFSNVSRVRLQEKGFGFFGIPELAVGESLTLRAGWCKTGHYQGRKGNQEKDWNDADTWPKSGAITVTRVKQAAKDSEPAVKDGLSVTVVPVKRAFGQKEPLQFSVTYHNQGQEEKRVRGAIYVIPLGKVVLRAGPQGPALVGIPPLGAFPAPGPKAQDVVLPAGAKETIRHTIGVTYGVGWSFREDKKDGAAIAWPLPAGKYTMTWTHDGLETKPVEFEIRAEALPAKR